MDTRLMLRLLLWLILWFIRPREAAVPDPFVRDEATVNSKLAAAHHQLDQTHDRRRRAEAAVRTAIAEEAAAVRAEDKAYRTIDALLDEKNLAAITELERQADQLVTP